MKPRLALGAATLALLTVWVPFSRADSPLTSIRFHQAYRAELAAALGDSSSPRGPGTENPPAPEQIIDFLVGDHPAALEAAAVNSLGWKFEGQKNGQLFLAALAEKKGLDPEILDFRDLRPADLLVLGYLLAMDDYFELGPLVSNASGLRGAPAIDLLSRAVVQEPRNFTYRIILALVRAQLEMESSFCAVYQNLSAVLTAFPESERDLKPEAVFEIMSYIGDYRDSCVTPETRAAEGPIEDPAFDEIYVVTEYRDWIATGTQVGIALWNKQSRQLDSVRPGGITTSLLVWNDQLWAASSQQVQRYDGREWRLYLDRPAATTSFLLVASRHGDLLAIHGGKTYRYDAMADQFQSVNPVFPNHPVPLHSCLVRKNGQVWGIDFMTSILAGARVIGLQSYEYPGRDPRSLMEDATGRLWIADFTDGFFRYDDREQRFVRDPVVEAKASALATDPESGTTYFLHYTDGLYVKEKTGKTESILLPDLQYMRDLYLDSDGVFWIAGWTQLLRLSKEDGEWKKTSLSVR